MSTNVTLVLSATNAKSGPDEHSIGLSHVAHACGFLYIDRLKTISNVNSALHFSESSLNNGRKLKCVNKSWASNLLPTVVVNQCLLCAI